jgi:hypothetical protein
VANYIRNILLFLTTVQLNENLSPPPPMLKSKTVLRVNKRTHYLPRSYNHCCSAKAMTTTNSECVCLALVIQHAMRMRHTVICGLSVSIIFLHIISQTTRFSKTVIEQLLSETFFLLRTERDDKKRSGGIQVKCLLFLSDFNRTRNL